MARLSSNIGWFAITLAILASCQRPEEKHPAQQMTSAEIQERLIEQNREALVHERRFIQDFIDSTGWDFQAGGSGAYEWRAVQGNGSAIQDKELVTIRFRLTGLHGDLYQEGSQQVRVLRDPNAVWGLQYALQRARHGDSIVLLLPAHLGHGVAGEGAVPPMSPLVYYLRVL